MKKQLLTLTLLLLGVIFLQAQVIFEEYFEADDLPSGWTIETNASDGGWNVGTTGSLSSQSFNVPDNGSGNVIGTNDDDCNCDKSADYLITPAIDLSGQTSVVLKVDIYFTGNTYQGSTETAQIAVSTDSVNWFPVKIISGETEWHSLNVNLTNYAGEEKVYISFRYNDDGGWLYGFALDNVVVDVPPVLDASFNKVVGRRFGEVGGSIPIRGEISNKGITEITSMEVSYSINGGSPTVEVLDNLAIPALDKADFELTNPWMPTATGIVDVEVAITAINGVPDEDQNNNSQSFETEIYEKVIAPNHIDEYLEVEPIFNVVATASNQLDRPTDLDFFPILARDEVWVINQRTENAGGSTLTINGASEPNPDFLHRVDGNSWHFMSLPTGIAFDPESFFFANSPGVQDANHSGGTFTGPSLWTSDPDIYAMPSGGNGSHMDMLHGSPFSMGIAHEVDNVYWVNDDWNKELVRYDFQEDHGPGNDYHGDAIVRRYRNLGLDADGDVPSHMVLDKTTGWMYVVDNGNDRVLRLDINSGFVGNSLPLINEPLAEHSAMADFTWETIIEVGLDRACGIEIMENRLLVSDYGTGDIIIFDMDNNFEEMGRINTGSPGITGLKVGPTGDIWFTNRILNTLTKVERGDPLSSEEELLVSNIRIAPNPTSGDLFVNIPEFTGNPVIDLYLKDVTGQQVMLVKNASSMQKMELGGLVNGVYLLSIVAGDFVETRRIVVSH